MTRVKRGYVAKKRRNNILKFTAGFKRAHSRLIRPAMQQRMKALAYSYKDRKKSKRNFRKLWIIRMNAALRQHNINYSQFIYRSKKIKFLLNRKMLAQIAILDETFFSTFITKINSDFHLNTINYAGPSSQEESIGPA